MDDILRAIYSKASRATQWKLGSLTRSGLGWLATTQDIDIHIGEDDDAWTVIRLVQSLCTWMCNHPGTLQRLQIDAQCDHDNLSQNVLFRTALSTGKNLKDAHFVISNLHMSPQCATLLLTKLTKLERLVYGGRIDQQCQGWVHLTSLTSLTIQSMVSRGEIEEEQDFGMLSTLTSLEKLVVTDACSPINVSKLSALRQLRHLDIKGSYDIYGVVQNVAGLSTLTNLEHLVLDSWSDCEDLRSLSTLTQLHTLHMSARNQRIEWTSEYDQLLLDTVIEPRDLYEMVGMFPRLHTLGVLDVSLIGLRAPNIKAMYTSVPALVETGSKLLLMGNEELVHPDTLYIQDACSSPFWDPYVLEKALHTLSARRVVLMNSSNMDPNALSHWFGIARNFNISFQ